MPKIFFDSKEIPIKIGQSILDAMIEFDCQPIYSCKKGVCQTCLLKSNDSQINSAQLDIKDTLKAQGYFLACQCYPQENIKVSIIENSDIDMDATLLSKTYISSEIAILKLALTIKNTVFMKPGQFISLTSEIKIPRSYSIANNPEKDKCVELHIQKVKHGKMSQYLYDKSKIGDRFKIRGPFGSCVYLENSINDSLILIGTGTGLAPLIGIIKQALNNHHQGTITLFHGSRYLEGLYLHDYLKSLALKNQNFNYYPCLSGEVSQELNDDIFFMGRVNKIAMSKIKQFNDTKFYLCGHPEMVKNMKKILYLSGADLNNINADPFEYTNYS
ncbi:hypothetical protein CJF42_18045 [Pseudoalteromonas sp. NBT06-2]|uniref:FAD-binding oxidoreductase n=1 Tax=Pseudoalteromonas sp. NBT06-2 TaxID=2025950 RepID=UPI000BA55303|nr:2Fe-2S iron-sulfur cluster binding domain-containing protein [Pseudoalteromonas sp. NBT06-2]PAJ73015.1 hypothetical protein CJF42_18045 [Pseudoalteromonas sp. NBT06-2]